MAFLRSLLVLLLALLLWVALCIDVSLAAASGKADFAFPETTLSRLAFGSCHKNKYAQTGDDANIWKTIQEQFHPQMWVWSGDAVYPPTRGVAPLEMLQKEYDQMKTNSSIGYSSFAPQLGVFGTWDDHDYGANDGGIEVPDKMLRAKQFWEFLGQPHPDQGQRRGLYSSVTIGQAPRQVKIIMLDTRWHRQKHCIPSIATKVPLGAGFACLTRWLSAGLLADWCKFPDHAVLGMQQWEWLEQQLSYNEEDDDAIPPSVTLVVSSIQVLSTNPSMEGWGHFPAERQRLLKLLSLTQKTKNSGLLYVLSGDVHHAELLAPHPASSFIEVTSSGLTHDCSKHIYGSLCKPLLEVYHRHRFEKKSNYYIGKNYGTVSLDWEQQTAEIQIHNETGHAVLTTGVQSWNATRRHFPQPLLSDQQISAVPACMDNHMWPMLHSLLVALVVAAVIVRVVRVGGGGSSSLPKTKT